MAQHPISLFFLLSLVASCVPVLTPVAACTTDADCEAGHSCQVDRCLPRPSTCGGDETRPCGPAPIGACKQGVQRCVDGMFEAACAGEVTAVAETCNAIDDDCDGEVDEGVLTTFYVDRDGDGFGSSAAGAETRMACSQPAGFSAVATDCDDVGASINPNGSELCDAAEVDENCDGTRNEGCGCSNIGMTQGCCAGRGTQTCEARDAGGGLLSACSVMPSTEACNSIDDDCDGQTDEQFEVGGLIDAGVIAPDGGCSSGLGACMRNGAPACVSGGLVCDAIAASPGTEICNTIDDDCDGQTDEVSATLCPTIGQTCSLGSCACPAGQSVCGSSCQSVGGTCSTGTGACTRQGAVLCSNGMAACDAVAGPPSTETCNNIDDDCDGQTDETSATLCPASGQTCALGTCACPSGQSVCGTSCQTLGGTCSAGVGACNRTGAIACISGGASCNATAGSPVAETCDGIDNDCNGTVDNGVTITCYPDGDNDRYATSATASQQCPDGSRTSFGSCPLGFVAPAASPGIDCAASDPAAYRQMSTMIDADGDSWCMGTTVQMLCVGNAPPAGRRFTSTCTTNADCNDANASLFQSLNVRVDSDGDTFCAAGTAFTECSGTGPLPGRRLATACASTVDCNDSSATAFLSYVVRSDSDNDGYCFGVSSTQCAGSSLPPNTRLSSACNATEDCKDTNPYAGATCVQVGAYWTGPAQKDCGLGFPQSIAVSLSSSCPAGFSRSGLYALHTSGDTGGTCTLTSETNLSMACGSIILGWFRCGIAGDCVAN